MSVREECRCHFLQGWSFLAFESVSRRHDLHR
jgi:hypothetical protein